MSDRKVLSIGDFLTGLDAENTAAVANDIRLYGNAFVEVVDGKKRRVSPHEVRRRNKPPQRKSVVAGATPLDPHPQAVAGLADKGTARAPV